MVLDIGEKNFSHFLTIGCVQGRTYLSELRLYL